MFQLLGMFGIGTTEMMIFALIVLLLFGNRLPGVMRSMGRGIVEFKKGVSGVDDEETKEVSDKKSEAKKAPAETVESEK
jgi:sec-independent protein translocase protein TatA